MERSNRKLSFRARNPEETKEKILTSAIEEFAEFGFLGARVERIALRGDVKMRMLYHYYKSKEYLYRVVLEHIFKQIETAEKEFEIQPGNPDEKMDHIIEFSFNLFVRNPTFVKLVMGQNYLEASHLRRLKSLGPRHEELKSMVKTVLEEGQAAGLFRREVDPEHLWITVYSLCWVHSANRHRLDFGAADSSDAEFLEARLRHTKDVISAFLRT